MTRKEYVQKFKDVVMDSVRGTGLFPSVVLAQAILESSDKMGRPGESTLAKLGNHFGIKADAAWKGKKINLKTREVYNSNSVMIGDWFRIYDDPRHSFIDRNLFLIRNPRYGKAGVFTAQTPFEQAHALQKAGYATDPLYAEKIKSLIQSLDLILIDLEAKKKDM